jgi:hypothetical protein
MFVCVLCTFILCLHSLRRDSHNDLGIPIITGVIKERSNKHHNRLETHTNPLMQPLLEEPNYRRLKRLLPTDLK